MKKPLHVVCLTLLSPAPYRNRQQHIFAVSIPLILWSLTAGGSGLEILSSMNVQFLVVDPAGRRTGYDSAARTEVSEIPSSRYGVKPTGLTDGARGDLSREFIASFGSPDHLIDGPYTLRVYGEKSGSFWLSISVYREPVSEDFNIGGTIRQGQVKTYRLLYDGDLSVPLRIDTVGSQ